ncbi:MAG: hypothetical protein L0099_08145 [Acidobacteria bacterium]|nr:hypothetical protein [Acidobacteriota bacterium]
MAEDCARGESRGWMEFVRDYRGLARRLLLNYFPALEPEISQHLTAVFRRARDSAWFSGLEFSNEREFLMAFRELVFAYGREAARLPAPTISVEKYVEVTKELSLVEREMLWLWLKGYDATRIAAMVANAAATAQAVQGVAGQKLAQVLPGAGVDVLRASVVQLLEAAAKAKSDQCLPWKTFNNLVNGQTSWRERELAEAHIKDCLNCLDRFTSFQEMIRLRKDTQPAPEAEINPVLADLGLAPARSRGLMGRLFSRT